MLVGNRIFATILLGLMLVACTPLFGKIAEVPDVQDLKIVWINATNAEISGLVAHSNFAVEKIEITRGGGAVNFGVRIAWARKGLTGRFREAIFVPHYVNRILFGANNTVVWQRK